MVFRGGSVEVRFLWTQHEQRMRGMSKVAGKGGGGAGRQAGWRLASEGLGLYPGVLDASKALRAMCMCWGEQSSRMCVCVSV